jgi:hypothetical protein
MDNNRTKTSIKRIIAEHMQTLDDFGICDKYDFSMRNKMEAAIAAKPDKDPDMVLELFCRPLIQDKINSWT